MELEKENIHEDAMQVFSYCGLISRGKCRETIETANKTSRHVQQ